MGMKVEAFSYLETLRSCAVHIAQDTRLSKAEKIEVLESALSAIAGTLEGLESGEEAEEEGTGEG